MLPTLPLKLLGQLDFEKLVLGQTPTEDVGVAHPLQGLAGAALITLQPLQFPGAEIRRGS